MSGECLRVELYGGGGVVTAGGERTDLHPAGADVRFRSH